MFDGADGLRVSGAQVGTVDIDSEFNSCDGHVCLCPQSLGIDDGSGRLRDGVINAQRTSV